jgi:hypothetical protein
VLEHHAVPIKGVGQDVVHHQVNGLMIIGHFFAVYLTTIPSDDHFTDLF